LPYKSLLLSPNLVSDILRENSPTTSPMAKGPCVSATSHIITTSQTNVHYYIKNQFKKQEKVLIKFKN
jgi:hypothetical protein